MKLLNDLWRGNIPLARCYWGFYFFGVLILTLPTRLWGVTDLQPPNIIPIVHFTVVYVYAFIALVGSWRSATRYQEEAFKSGIEYRKKKKIWGTLAKAGVILGFGFVIQDIGFTVRDYDGRLDSYELQEIATDLNQHVPIRIDKSTVLEKVYVEDQTLVYEYHMKDVSSQEFSLDTVRFRKDILEKNCVDDAFSRFVFGQGGKVKHTYIESGGTEMDSIVIDQEVCRAEEIKNRGN